MALGFPSTMEGKARVYVWVAQGTSPFPDLGTHFLGITAQGLDFPGTRNELQWYQDRKDVIEVHSIAPPA